MALHSDGFRFKGKECGKIPAGRQELLVERLDMPAMALGELIAELIAYLASMAFDVSMVQVDSLTGKLPKVRGKGNPEKLTSQRRVIDLPNMEPVVRGPDGSAGLPQEENLLS
ncbi:hypothetical protein AK812_SmicGene38844 [Symbiodinium microadriaticum]|uniref:Uncharacterized protein n=1 Tax=Symbiodinium microadriaticum TaxID=2951 RepID=A0A1Q9CCZ4_SYMMI|nr:hypothetical protein AK812_SmicGene38844 [Symbiodinium microadriaticum]